MSPVQTPCADAPEGDYCLAFHVVQDGAWSGCEQNGDDGELQCRAVAAECSAFQKPTDKDAGELTPAARTVDYTAPSFGGTGQGVAV